MKLAFAIFKYYPFGGLEKSFLNICKEAIGRGHELTIFCSLWEGERLPFATIVELPVHALSNHGKLRKFHQLLMQRYRQGSFDVLVGFKRIPDLDVYYNGDVCFVQEAENKHGNWYKLLPRYRTMAKLESAVFSPSSKTHILFISQREKEIYQRRYNTPEGRFHALPAGINKGAIRGAIQSNIGASIREQHQLTNEDVVLIMVGSDFKRKGVDRAISAIASLSPRIRSRIKLWIVGAGETAPYEKQALRLGVSDQLLFFGARNDVPGLLAAADVLLHPARVETAGNAIVEGLVAGIPVVVSASAGFSFHVTASGGGLIIDDGPYRQEDFDHAVFLMVTDAALRKEQGLKGWNYADNTDLYCRAQVAVDTIESAADGVLGNV